MAMLNNQMVSMIEHVQTYKTTVDMLMFIWYV